MNSFGLQILCSYGGDVDSCSAVGERQNVEHQVYKFEDLRTMERFASTLYIGSISIEIVYHVWSLYRLLSRSRKEKRQYTFALGFLGMVELIC